MKKLVIFRLFWLLVAVLSSAFAFTDWFGYTGGGLPAYIFFTSWSVWAGLVVAVAHTAAAVYAAINEKKRGRLSDSGDHVLQRLYAVYYGVRNYARLHIFQRAGKVFYRQRLFQTRAFTGFRDCRLVSVCPRNGFFKTVSVPFARLSARLLDRDDRPYFSYTFGLRRLGTAGKMEFLLPVSVYEYR